jgi:hypothetical protein
MNNKTITKKQGERIWTTRLPLLLKTRENTYEQQDYYSKHGESIWTTILLLKSRENAYEQQDYY